ncbi:hypothetical protein GAPWKB30_0707 [Gilliamella apicola]|nr:hypothetical protein GAPWKB30_0707 [Gilliamella apicola]
MVTVFSHKLLLERYQNKHTNKINMFSEQFLPKAVEFFI